MAQVSITEAARLTDVSEKTIRRKIASGELSAHVQGQGGQAKKLIDTSELLRVFGSMSGQPAPPVQSESPAMPTQAPDMSTHPAAAFQQIIETQQTLIDVLKAQLDARTQETRELRAQVTGLLEWRRPDPTAASGPVETPLVSPDTQTLSLDNRTLVLTLVLILGTLAIGVVAWSWALGYRLWFIT